MPSPSADAVNIITFTEVTWDVPKLKTIKFAQHSSLPSKLIGVDCVSDSPDFVRNISIPDIPLLSMGTGGVSANVVD